MNILSNENIEKIKALELSNFIDKMEQEFSNGEDGYYKKLGKDAIHDSYKMKGGALEELQKFEAEINKKASESGNFNSVIAEEIKNKKLEMIRDNLFAHERNQFLNWMNLTISEGIEAAIKKAILHRDSKDEIEKIIQNGRVIIIQKGALNNALSSQIKEEIALFENRVTKEILESYAIDGNLKIIDFFEEYKKNLNNEEIEKYSKIADETKEKYLAEKLSGETFALFSADKKKAFEELKKAKGNDLAFTLLTSDFVLAKKQEEKAQNELLSQMFQEISNAEKNLSSFKYSLIPNGLNEENKNNAKNYLEKKMKGEKIETKNEDFFFLFEKFLCGELTDFNFIKYKMSLSDYDFKLFSKLQEMSFNLTFAEIKDLRFSFIKNLKSIGENKTDFIRCTLDEILVLKKTKKEMTGYDEIEHILEKRLSEFETLEDKNTKNGFFNSLKTVFKRE